MSRRIDALKDRFLELARAIDVPRSFVSFNEHATHDGSVHVELAGSHLYYVVTERGIEFERRHTEDPDTLLYWLVRDLTFQAACDWELKHRRENEDFRRQLFAKQLELLGSVKEEWRATREAEIRLTLAEHPFRDEKTG